MKIICLGDSLTAGYNIRPDECWVSILQQETQHEWINGGISGDTSQGVLVRLQTWAVPQHPDYILLLCGFNDIMVTASCDLAKASIMAMIHQCVAAGIKPVLGIPFPIENLPERYRDICRAEKVKSALIEYITWLRNLAEVMSLRRVDFAAVFEEAQRKGAKALYQSDGMHPTAAGSRLMADAVEESGYFADF